MDITKIKPEDLDRVKLSFISLGSVCGIGLGLLISILIESTLVKAIIAIILLLFGVSLIFQRIHLLLI